MLDLGLQAGLAFIVGMGILPVIGGLASLRIRERRERPGLPRVRRLLRRVDHLPRRLHGGEGHLPLDDFATLDRGAQPDLPLAADADRDGARLPLAPDQLVARRRRLRRSSPTSCSRSRSSCSTRTSRRPASRSSRSPTATGAGTTRTCSCCCSGCSPCRCSLLVWRRRPRSPRRAAVLMPAWLLTAQIAATVGFDNFANGLRSGLPQQLDWVDRETGRAAGHLPRAGDHRRERAAVDGVLEPLDPPRLQPRLRPRPAPGPTVRPT